ncbi:MAG: multicopper oxidase family protein [Paracoccus sp. (in: a-proteobacteria)]
MTHFTRRGFLAATAAMAAIPAAPGMARAAAPERLLATSRVLDIDGRAATVWGLLNARGGTGLTLDPGQRFALRLTNDLPEPTLIHWHGQIPPHAQDGVPGLPAAMLQPGEGRDYDYAPISGTFWMHAHIPLQEMRQLAAPLIVRSASDVAADRQEVVMMLHDFSFAAPEEVMAAITGGHGGGHGAHGAPADPHAGHGAAPVDPHAGHDMGGAGVSQMDLNDFDFDAYLANDRTLSDPEVTRVERGGRVLLRIINGAAATAFWVDLGALSGRLVAVDGHPVVPQDGSRFAISMGQRLDIELRLSGAGAFPILALREGAVQRTGIVLATPGARIPQIPATGDAAPAVDYDLAQEGGLRAATALPQRGAEVSQMVMLGGSMDPYRWTIDDRIWGDHMPVTARSGQRVELTFHNLSMMSHPMHLHGHVFQVVAIDGRRFAGALRDTVLVPPQKAVTVAFDAGEAARWMLHCHHMPHLETGMMTELAVLA